MLPLKNKADLEALHSGNVKESLNLEYKASAAIDKRDDSKKIEMARDVSAFANADGGQVIYGMTENDHEPAGLDSGVDAKTYPEIWFEQVLQQHVTPSIAGLQVRHIPLSKSMVAIVVSVPATKGDPHQVSDGRYYRRHNFNRLMMEHYEVRDSFRRSVDPDLYVEFDDAKGDRAYANVEFTQFRDLSDPIFLGITARNRSSQPALYSTISVLIDERVVLHSPGKFENQGVVSLGPNDKRFHLLKVLMVPEQFPIFKEAPYPVGQISFKIRDRLLGQNLRLGYIIRAPGCARQEHGHIEIGPSGQLFIRMGEQANC
jgi:Putative DNA-binding domain